MKQFLSTMTTLWFKPKVFFQEMYPSQSKQSAILFGSIMIICGLPIKIAGIFLEHYHWLEIPDKLVSLAVAWLVFTFAMGICVNILKGTGDFNAAFKLGAFLSVIHVGHLLILPFFVGIIALNPVINKDHFFMLSLYITTAALYALFIYLVLRFFYIAYVGIQSVFTLSRKQTIIAMLCVGIVVFIMMVVVKIPFYTAIHWNQL